MASSERGKKDTATALDDAEKARLLRRSFIFRDMEETMLGRLARLSQTHRLAKGNLLFHQGEEGDALYGVAEGLIRIWVSGDGGKELTLQLLEPGDVFGEIALLDGLPRSASAEAVDDPVWRMPLWDAYDEMLKSDIADLANAAGGSPMAGAIVAAMFLKRFVPKDVPWAHFDTYAWRDKGKPGRPKGGEALGLRAVFAYLCGVYYAI